MLVVAYLTVQQDIKIADANDDDSPLGALRFINEAARDLDEAAKLRVGAVLAKAIADELRLAYEPL